MTAPRFKHDILLTFASHAQSAPKKSLPRQPGDPQAAVYGMSRILSFTGSATIGIRSSKVAAELNGMFV